MKIVDQLKEQEMNKFNTLLENTSFKDELENENN